MWQTSIEVFSPYRIGIGLFFQSGSTEIVDGVEREFKEIAISLFFIYIRITKYK
jgi:hypothetical protein